MNNERQTAEVIRSWMREEVELDDTGIGRVLSLVPDTPQRRHRWLWPLDWRPLGNGATRSASAREATRSWRFSTMFTPIRVAALTAVLALTGTLALVSGPLAPTGPVPAPGAEVSTVSMEPAHFTGTLSAWDTGTADVETLPDRTIERWPVAWVNTMSDPRVNGRGEAMDYLESIRGSDGAVFLSHTGAGRLVNDEGTYAVECHGAGSTDAVASIYCWYEGEEGYDGLTAFVILSQRASGSGTWDTEGWIFPAERPPLLPFEPQP